MSGKVSSNSNGFLASVVGVVLSAGFIAAAGSLAFFSWMSDEMLEGDTARFDEAVRSGVHAFASPAVTAAMKVITFFGSTIGISIGIAIVLISFLWTKHKRSAAVFAAAMAGTSLLEVLLKLLFARPRPQPYFDIPPPSTYSYPSGHAFFSICFYGSLAWIFLRHAFSPVSKIFVSIAAVVLILLIGLSRIYLGVHYPSDVIAGYSAGIIWLIAVSTADAYISGPERKATGREKKV